MKKINKKLTRSVMAMVLGGVMGMGVLMPRAEATTANTTNTINGQAISLTGDANGSYSVSLGGSNTVKTDSSSYSVAMGDNNTASGNYSVALGHGNKATGSYSVAMGACNIASDSASVAMGEGTSPAAGAALRWVKETRQVERQAWH